MLIDRNQDSVEFEVWFKSCQESDEIDSSDLKCMTKAAWSVSRTMFMSNIINFIYNKNHDNFEKWFSEYHDIACHEYGGIDYSDPKGIAKDAWESAIFNILKS